MVAARKESGAVRRCASVVTWLQLAAAHGSLAPLAAAGKPATHAPATPHASAARGHAEASLEPDGSVHSSRAEGALLRSEAAAHERGQADFSALQERRLSGVQRNAGVAHELRVQALEASGLPDVDVVWGQTSSYCVISIEGKEGVWNVTTGVAWDDLNPKWPQPESEKSVLPNFVPGDYVKFTVWVRNHIQADTLLGTVRVYTDYFFPDPRGFQGWLEMQLEAPPAGSRDAPELFVQIQEVPISPYGEVR